MRFKCGFCGRDIERASRQVKKGAKNTFCSKNCHDQYRRKAMYAKMCVKVGGDFSDWLTQKYWDEQLDTYQIAIILYDKPKNAPNVLGWMKKLNIPRRERSEAVAMQWEGNDERRLMTSENAKVCLNTAKSRDKLRRIMKTPEYIAKSSSVKMGEKNPMWDPTLSQEERERNRFNNRIYPSYKFFRRQVYERDNYTCQKCGSNTGGNLVVHHIKSFKNYPELRTDPNNGITFCESCHKLYHKTYGQIGANETDFKKFMR